jgi:glutaredoxin-like protein
MAAEDPTAPTAGARDASAPDVSAPGVSAPDAGTASAVDFYWRPGCGFCSMLRRKLARRDIPVREHNIWEDPEAAAVVRAAASGNETVPTVGVAGHHLVNPSLREVERLLAEHAPALLGGR